jgi:transcription antitermination factor NusG
MADWLVVVALPKLEKQAHASLTGMGFNCYQPRYRERHIVNGRNHWVEHLLLGRYLLIEFVFDFIANYHAIVTAKGVSSLLICDEKPRAARESDVQQLMSSEVKGCVPVIVQRNRFTAGQRTIVTKGPFRTFEGQYVEGKEDRDVVELEIFGSLTPVELELGSLIAA